MTRKRRSLAQFLATPAAYEPRPQQVEIHETHISWVFVTDRFAFKLKKPVRFEFLDFSTPALRREACEAEVRLNRRLTDDLYLGVLPVFEHAPGDFQIGAAEQSGDGDNKIAERGTAVDWIVWMRRLPLDRSLDRLIEERRVADEDIARLAQRLAQFYRSAPPLDIDPADYRRAIEQHVRANLADLLAPAHDLPTTVVRRSHGAQLRWLATHAALLAQRVSAGRIIEGHGDLRPEHICLAEPIQIFDCLEFNAEFRRLDVVDELAFLAMECDMLGAASIEERIIATYSAATGDVPPTDLVAFYKSYRAAVRAKVAALRAAQLPDDEAASARQVARRYLERCDREAAALGRPPLVVVRGLMGSGKSTVARAIAERIGAQYLATDVIRRELFGPSQQAAGFGEGNYTSQRRREVYDQLLHAADELLAGGEAVVLDGTFLAAADQQRTAEIASARGLPALVVNCRCPADVARERIARRLATGDDASEARPELLDAQQALDEPTPAGLPSVTIDTNRPLEENLESVFTSAWT
ncbi:MAG: AAA family ATPase [Pirellulales bacterium]